MLCLLRGFYIQANVHYMESENDWAFIKGELVYACVWESSLQHPYYDYLNTIYPSVCVCVGGWVGGGVGGYGCVGGWVFV